MFRYLNVLFPVFLFFQAASVMSQANDRYVPLDRGALAYVFTNVKEARSILDIIPVGEFRTWQAVLILDNTNTAAAALFPKETGKRFQIAGWGNYPSIRGSVALFISRSWKRHRSDKGTYWASNSDKLSIALGSRQVHAAFWHGIPGNPVPSLPGVEIPDEFYRFRRRTGSDAPLSCWMINPGQLLSHILNSEGIPLNLPAQRLFINLSPAAQSEPEDKFEVSIRLHFEDSDQAQFAAENMAIAQEQAQEAYSKANPILMSLFFGNPVIQHGRSIDIVSALLNMDEVALLLKLFLLYWN
jgi:hypothetical protein